MPPCSCAFFSRDIATLAGFRRPASFPIGTGISNPSPSSEASANFRSLFALSLSRESMRSVPRKTRSGRSRYLDRADFPVAGNQTGRGESKEAP